MDNRIIYIFFEGIIKLNYGIENKIYFKNGRM